MHYDCHLEVGSLTPRDRVATHLRRWKPSGVVFVQKGSDPRSRAEWVTHMNSVRGACGVAMVTPYDGHDGFVHLASLGVCGALLPVISSVPVARIHDEVIRLHEALPRHWHIELDVSWNMAARLAPLLARMDRRFCLTPQFTRAGITDQAVRQVLWWFDMGNAYLKLTHGQVETSPHALSHLVCRHSPDRVVFGSGELPVGADDGWLDERFIPPDQANDNAQRLYPFFKHPPLH